MCPSFLDCFPNIGVLVRVKRKKTFGDVCWELAFGLFGLSETEEFLISASCLLALCGIG